MTRLFWVSLGGLSLALAVLGAFLPLLPTTPFLLLSAFCFARSSQRLHDWLVGHPRLGPPIENWRREGAISRRAKLLAVIALVAAFLISLALGAGTTILAIQAVVLSLSGIFILTRPTPSHEREE